MKICRRCNVLMKSGTHYEKERSKRYTECPKCYEKVYSNGDSFRDILHSKLKK